jgi:ankyrin repeat protein/class 3 adenylate cyclase
MERPLNRFTVFAAEGSRKVLFKIYLFGNVLNKTIGLVSQQHKMKPELFHAVLQSAGMVHLRSVLSKNCRNKDIDASDRDGRTALHLACLEGRDDAVQLLLEYGANLDTHDHLGNQPFKEAITRGAKSIVGILARAGAELSPESRADLECEMCRAAAEGNLAKLKSFIECGISANSIDYGKRSALHLAASYGHLDVVQYLLESGSNTHAVDRLGRTPMDDAQDAGHHSIQKLLGRFTSSKSDEPELHIGHGQLNWIESFFKPNTASSSSASACIDDIPTWASSLFHPTQEPRDHAVASCELDSAEHSSLAKRLRRTCSSSTSHGARDRPPKAPKLSIADSDDQAAPPHRCSNAAAAPTAAAERSPSPVRHRTRTAARATVVCIDIKGFTERCAAMSAGAAAAWVADFYARVDRAAAACGVRKADVRGDCCICVAGDDEGYDGGDAGAPPPPAPHLSSQATRALAFATAVHAELAGASAGAGAHGAGERQPITARMGVATGRVAFLGGDTAAGFSGVQGEAVSAAARMEGLSRPGVAVVHESAAEQWAAETGRRPPRAACCRAGKGGAAGLERAAAFDCARGEFVGAAGAAELLPEAGLRSLGRGEWPALRLRRSLACP